MSSGKLEFVSRSCLLWFSAFLVSVAAGAESPRFRNARLLATNICDVFHLFPAPEALDRFTWSNRVQPLMRTKMGVASLENNPSPDARTLMEQWNAIWNDYYLVEAPEQTPPQDPRAPIKPDLDLFEVEDP